MIGRLAGLCGVALLACSSPRPAAPVERSVAVVADAAIAPVAVVAEPPLDAGHADAEVVAGLAPLAGAPFETWRSGELEVVASLPLGARERRPVVVGVHGSRDRPDAACARWRRTLAAWAFVVCPKGVPYRGGLAWGSPVGLAERIDGALAALRERHGEYVAEGPVVYAGWSLGATRGPQVVGTRAGVFDPVVLVEVGHTRIDATASAKSLRSGKADHVLVACATKRCATFAKKLEKASGSAPAVAFVDAGIGRGHVFDDRTASTLGAALAHAVASDPRWSGLAAALANPPSDDVGTQPLPDEDEEPELVP